VLPGSLFAKLREPRGDATAGVSELPGAVINDLFAALAVDE
jgi:hypothetical protein